MAKGPAAICHFEFSLSVVVLALLVSNTAGGLASRLAGGLAFAAAAAVYALVQVTSFDSSDSVHFVSPYKSVCFHTYFYLTDPLYFTFAGVSIF